MWNDEKKKLVRLLRLNTFTTLLLQNTIVTRMMYAFGRRKEEARADVATLRKRVEEGLKNKLPQEVPVPAPVTTPTKRTPGINASWHNKPKSSYYSDKKISDEEFQCRLDLPHGSYIVMVIIFFLSFTAIAL